MKTPLTLKENFVVFLLAMVFGLTIGLVFVAYELDKAHTEAENARATLADAYCVTPSK